MAIVSILGIISPLLQEKLFDEGIMAKNFNSVIKYTLYMVLLFGVIQLFEFIQFSHYEYINKQVPFMLLYDTISHSLNLKIAYFKDNNFSKVINNTYKDISDITQVVNASILQSAISLFKIIGGIIGLCLINWKLTIFVLTIVPVEIVTQNLFSSHRRKLTQKMMSYHEKFAIWFSETFNNIEVLKLWNLQQRRKEQFVEMQRKMIKTDTKIDYIDNYSQITSSFINMFFSYGLNLLGAYLIIGDDLTVGGLFAFISYSMYVMQPIALLSSILYKLSSSVPSFERFLGYLHNETEVTEGKRVVDCFDKIESITFDNVTFSYDNKKPLLNSISFNIHNGEKVAFIGLNGSGKSSILNLLLRFFEPISGTVMINDTNIQNIAINEYRDLFSVMNQSLFMFDENIKNNININNEVNNTELELYLQLLNASEFINSLPEGLDTYVGYNGAKLSGGEKQKILLARTLAKKSKILILDEATASFDMNAEKQFNEYISKTNHYEIIIIITHRMDILKKMDKIFIVENGVITDSGTFDELEAKNIDFNNILIKEKEIDNENGCSN
jgi:ATP-binding cassette subfamily B protein